MCLLKFSELSIVTPKSTKWSTIGTCTTLMLKDRSQEYFFWKSNTFTFLGIEHKLIIVKPTTRNSEIAIDLFDVVVVEIIHQCFTDPRLTFQYKRAYSESIFLWSYVRLLDFHWIFFMIHKLLSKSFLIVYFYQSQVSHLLFYECFQDFPTSGSRSLKLIWLSSARCPWVVSLKAEKLKPALKLVYHALCSSETVTASTN